MNLEHVALHISFSLYGDDPKYTEGAVQNAMIAPHVYPGSIVRIYHDTTVPAQVLARLKALGCELVDMTGTGVFGMFWRFLIHDDPGVGRWISRDVDSRLNTREWEAVREWIESGKELHIMRDHPWHSRVCMGGMFGIAGKRIRMQDLVAGWPRKQAYQDDQDFLEQCVVPRYCDSCLVHDSYRHIRHGNLANLPSQDFPSPRVGRQFVGAVLDANNQPMERQLQAL